MYKELLFIFLIISPTQIVEAAAHSEPNLLSIIGDSFANSAKYFSKAIGSVLNIQNQVTPTLCNLNTVRIGFASEIYLLS